jgi:hypothetical protein
VNAYFSNGVNGNGIMDKPSYWKDSLLDFGYKNVVDLV